MATLTYKENVLRVMQHKEPEYMPMPSDLNFGFPSPIREVGKTDDGSPGLDWFGQSWTFEPTIGGYNPTPNVHLITDITRWREQMKFPDLDAIDWEAAAAKDTARWDRENKFSRITVGYGLWERMFSTMEFTEALMSLIDEPEACYDFFGAVADYKIDLFNRIIRYYKPDQIVFHDDYGNSRSMFMSPETWRELIKPHLQRVIDCVTSQGVFYEHHCCGNFIPIMEEIADMGASSINPFQININPPEIKQRLQHKLSFFGGFDVQYFEKDTTTVEEVREHIRHVLDLIAPGGSFFPYVKSMNPEKNAAIMEELATYGNKFYSCPRP